MALNCSSSTCITFPYNKIRNPTNTSSLTLKTGFFHLTQKSPFRVSAATSPAKARFVASRKESVRVRQLQRPLSNVSNLFLFSISFKYKTSVCLEIKVILSIKYFVSEEAHFFSSWKRVIWCVLIVFALRNRFLGQKVSSNCILRMGFVVFNWNVYKCFSAFAKCFFYKQKHLKWFLKALVRYFF